MSILDTKFTNMSLLWEVFSKYIIRLNELVTSSNLGLLSRVKDHQNESNKSKNKLEKLISAWKSKDVKLLKFDEYSHLAFKLFSSNMNIDINIDKVYNILSTKIDINIESDVSTTSVLDVSDRFEKVTMSYNNYLKRRDIDNSDMIELLSGSLFRLSLDHINCYTAEHKPQPYKIVQKFYRHDDNTVGLYANFMQKTIDYYHKNNLPDRFLPGIQLEEDKTWQLTQSSNDIRKIKASSLISRWNLIPLTEFKSINEIFDMLFKVKIKLPLDQQKSSGKIKWLDIVNTVSKLTKIHFNLIVITKISPSVIEHDISKIMGSMADQYVVSENEGVSHKNINKFTTLHFSTAKKWDFDIKLYTSSSNIDDKFYIIETLDGIRFRILSRFESEIYALKQHHITKLLSYIQDKKQVSRITEYNKTLENDIYKNMIQSNMLDLEQIAAESAYKIDTGPLKQKIIIELMKIFDVLIKKHHPLDLPSLRSILYVSELENRFMEIQIEMFKSDSVYFKLKHSSDKMFSQRHILDSFLYDLADNLRIFNRELNDHFQKIVRDIEKTENINEWSSPIKQIKFRSIFERSLKLTLDTIMTRENNVFQNIAFKIDMLNKI